MLLNFNELFSAGLNKKFSISEETKAPPEIAEEHYIWTDNSLVKVLRNYSDSLEQSQYLLKYDDLFLELLYLLNEGYLTCDVEEYDYLMIDYSEGAETALNKLKQIPQELHNELASLFSYSNEITMNYSIWEKLRATGGQEFKFSNRNYSIHAKDIELMSKTGNVSIKYLLNAFEKGIKKFIVAPYTTTDQGIVYIFSTTNKYMKLVENKTRQKKELKKAFSKIKGDYTPNFTVYNNESLDASDMVEFIYKGKKIRGYIDEIVNNTIDFEQYIQKNERVLEQDRASNFLLHLKQRANINFYFTVDEFNTADYIIKALRKTKTSESHNYYAVNKKDILSYWSMDNEQSMGEDIQQMLILGKEINPTITYKLDQSNKTTINANAYYTPFEHTITININTLINSSYENYTLHGYHPDDFALCVIAHELGHADLRGSAVFDNQYNSRVNLINKLTKIIEQEIAQIELSVEPDIAMIRETIKKCTERIGLLQRHYDQVMQSEMNAYIYGLDYISCDNLKCLFQKNNYDTYTRYLEKELRPIRMAQRQLYELQRLVQLLN